MKTVERLEDVSKASELGILRFLEVKALAVLGSSGLGPFKGCRASVRA